MNTFKIVQVYAQTCSHSDVEIGSVYEEAQLVCNKAKTHSVITGILTAMTGKEIKQASDGNNRISTRNERGQMQSAFAEARSLGNMNSFSKKRLEQK